MSTPTTKPKSKWQELILDGIDGHMTMTSLDESLFVNRCFEGDLVIEFGEVSPEQRRTIEQVVDSINQLIGKFKPTRSSYSYAHQKLFDELLPLLREANFTEFQIDQIRLHPKSLALLLCNKQIEDPYQHDIPALIVNNFTREALQTIGSIMSSRYLYSSFDFAEYMDMDRNGFIFKALRKYLIHSNLIIPGKNSHITGQLIVNLSRYLKNNDLEMYIIDMTRHLQVRTKRYIYGKELRIEEQYFKCNEEADANEKFKSLYKELTNKDYKPNDIFPPSENNEFFGHFEAITEKRYRIPTLKQIGFSVLSEMFLINKTDFMEKINHLTLDTLRDFLIYCFQNQKPVGGEIAMFLLGKLKSSHSEESLEELFPFQPFIESVFNRHRWFYRSMIGDVPQSLIRPPYDANLLINVYENRDLFKPKQLPEANLLFSQKVSPNPLVLQDKKTFLDNLKKNTDGFFESLDMSNMVIIGGIMTSSLSGETAGFESSDIDVCFYGLSETDITARIVKIVEHINANYTGHSITYSDNEITFCRHYPYRHIQFNCTLFNNIQDVLLGVDIEASCFAFDGTNVWTTQRGIEAFNYRTNFASPYGFVIRGDQIYQRRLLKYLERGFNIAYLPNDKLAESVKMMNNEKKRSNGIELLFKARNNPEVFKSLLERNKLGGLPYGPTITKEIFNKKVANNHDNNYDGYNSSDWPQVLEGIDDLEYFTPALNGDNGVYLSSSFYQFLFVGTEEPDHDFNEDFLFENDEAGGAGANDDGDDDDEDEVEVEDVDEYLDGDSNEDMEEDSDESNEMAVDNPNPGQNMFSVLDDNN
ncbi:hypothetical protein PPL_11591 [Heterostelium album PN500]|uniref:Uncharacterized protein n=1 Tax=Heterostelium pallidum (strain ATCC 26659 / Pp 5 / PN500) TaxID=670386 RepID=D3BV66_HETP5|nr:hypothetical protein PPL_11591 [Heterostelium album PN500]EFA74623.1 hypothetical protein PPL_11591 [Heterostelium album PN500]|eukprot:XP_020426757.1 hypothetical protein PPL_11591 [Heterostelium album PN500]